jgi:hypothetical protein
MSVGGGDGGGGGGGNSSSSSSSRSSSSSSCNFVTKIITITEENVYAGIEIIMKNVAIRQSGMIVLAYISITPMEGCSYATLTR